LKRPSTKKIISVADMCAVTEYSERWLRDLAKQGHIQTPIKGEYPMIETLRGIIRFLKQRAHQGGTMAEEKLRKLKEEADRVALENAARREELCDKQDLLSRLAVIYTAMSQRILNSSLRDHEKDALLQELNNAHSL